MNTKKWLALGLSVALAATAALAACAPTEPNPNEGDNPSTPHTHTFTKWDHSDTEHWRVCPDDGEIDVSTRAKHSFNRVTHVCISCGYEEPHTHSYTAWRYDILQHWKACPGDEAVDETTRADHNYVEGVCEDCGRKEPEMYVYGLGREAFGNTRWPTMSDIRDKKDRWVKMELGEDGKYTADVYLTPDALFAVGDAASLVRYPAAEDPDATTGALQVEAANTYTVTFDPADGSVTFAVHAHTYDVWKYDADNHWKVCSTKDQAVDESSRGAHVYDQEGGKCVCGAVQTVSCDHSKGYVFDYTELPECNAEGGTLQKVCPDCHDAQDVIYSKGFTGDTTAPMTPSTIGDISEEGAFYFTTGDKFQTLGLKITEAGTYTLTFEEVCDLNGKDNKDGQLALSGLAFGNSSYASSFSAGCIMASNIRKLAELTNYAVKYNGKDVAVKDDLKGELVTFSFTVTEEQLQAGDLYVTIHLAGFTNESRSTRASADSLSHLVTVKKD